MKRGGTMSHEHGNPLHLKIPGEGMRQAKAVEIGAIGVWSRGRAFLNSMIHQISNVPLICPRVPGTSILRHGVTMGLLNLPPFVTSESQDPTKSHQNHQIPWSSGLPPGLGAESFLLQRQNACDLLRSLFPAALPSILGDSPRANIPIWSRVNFGNQKKGQNVCAYPHYSIFIYYILSKQSRQNMSKLSGVACPEEGRKSISGAQPAALKLHWQCCLAWHSYPLLIWHYEQNWDFLGYLMIS